MQKLIGWRSQETRSEANIGFRRAFAFLPWNPSSGGSNFKLSDTVTVSEMFKARTWSLQTPPFGEPTLLWLVRWPQSVVIGLFCSDWPDVVIGLLCSDWSDGPVCRDWSTLILLVRWLSLLWLVYSTQIVKCEKWIYCHNTSSHKTAYSRHVDNKNQTLPVSATTTVFEGVKVDVVGNLDQVFHYANVLYCWR